MTKLRESNQDLARGGVNLADKAVPDAQPDAHELINLMKELAEVTQEETRQPLGSRSARSALQRPVRLPTRKVPTHGF